jgi:hypothetical protein
MTSSLADIVEIVFQQDSRDKKTFVIGNKRQYGKKHLKDELLMQRTCCKSQ